MTGDARLCPALSAAGATVELDGVDLLDPDFHASGDPHAVWDALRACSPLHRQTLGDGRCFWSVTRYADACRVLGDHRSFTSERGNLVTQLGANDVASGRMLVSTDPPRHGALRRPMARFVGDSAVRELLEEGIRRAVSAALAPARVGGDWDVAQRAATLPMAVAGALLGLPEEDWAKVARWSGMAVAPEDDAYSKGSPGVTLALAHHELLEYLGDAVAARSTADGARDLLDHMAGTGEEAGAMSDEEAVLNAYSVLLGANATTPHTAAGTLRALMEHRDQLDAVRADPALLPGLVEEGLRWTSAASSFLRHAVVDVDLSGGRVPAGDAVVVWVGSANRDERMFPRPHDFDITRAGNRHIAFGYGPHYCLGAGLARLTLRLFFEELLPLAGALEPAGSAHRLKSAFVAGYTRLPVRTAPG